MSYESLKKRLDYFGGDSLGRINKQKLLSFKKALKNDYNSRTIRTSKGEIWQCIMNLNNLKADYDKKYISIEYDAGLKPGDVFTVLDNPTTSIDDSHWMVYLPDLIETAYLRSEIIRCRYTMEVNGETYWVYLQGPTATDVDWQQKQSVNFTTPNWDGEIYIKNTPTTQDYFHRFDKIKVAGKTWEIQVVDSISVPGIIELQLQEYYTNTIENLPKIVKEKPEVVDGETIPQIIIGASKVKKNTIVGYSIIKEAYTPSDDKWGIEGNDKVAINSIKEDGRICEVAVDKDAEGEFTIIYGNNSMTVIVDEAKAEIIGDRLVSPYSVHRYAIDKKAGEFYIDSPLAKITYSDPSHCEVEIISGKKGSFVLQYVEQGTNNQYELPITIKSL